MLQRLDQAARRGRLPGFTPQVRGGLFAVELAGMPFDADLIAEPVARPSDSGSDSAGENPAGPPGAAGVLDRVLRFRIRWRRRLPVAVAGVLLSTIWPGVYFVDRLIPGQWGWIPTWWWYVPISALPLPCIWATLIRRSRGAHAEQARQMIAQIAAELDGTVIEAKPEPPAPASHEPAERPRLRTGAAAPTPRRDPRPRP